MKKNKKLIKDKTRNNFARAVEWLITNGVVKNQKNMAERMGYYAEHHLTKQAWKCRAAR